MKTLLTTTVWLPNLDDPARQQIIEDHLNQFLLYRGEWDLQLVNNSACTLPMVEDFQTKFTQKFPNKLLIINWHPENIGWCRARNLGLDYMMENNYDLIIQSDCDTYCNNLNWIINCQKFSEEQPAFQIRQYDRADQIGNYFVANGQMICKYVDWWGNINILTRQVVEVVGGFDYETFPMQWGFHDIEYGRRLLKAGFFDRYGAYTALLGQENFDVVNSEYDQKTLPEKDRLRNENYRKFAQVEYDIQTGKKDLYFSPKPGIDITNP